MEARGLGTERVRRPIVPLAQVHEHDVGPRLVERLDLRNHLRLRAGPCRSRDMWTVRRSSAAANPQLRDCARLLPQIWRHKEPRPIECGHRQDGENAQRKHDKDGHNHDRRTMTIGTLGDTDDHGEDHEHQRASHDHRRQAPHVRPPPDGTPGPYGRYRAQWRDLATAKAHGRTHDGRDANEEGDPIYRRHRPAGLQSADLEFRGGGRRLARVAELSHAEQSCCTWRSRVDTAPLPQRGKRGSAGGGARSRVGTSTETLRAGRHRLLRPRFRRPTGVGLRPAKTPTWRASTSPPRSRFRFP